MTLDCLTMIAGVLYLAITGFVFVAQAYEASISESSFTFSQSCVLGALICVVITLAQGALDRIRLWLLTR